MSFSRYKFWTLVGIALLCVPGGTRAQQPNQGQGQAQDEAQPQDQPQPQEPYQAPIPAYRSPFAGGNVEQAPQELTPDTQPLAGVQTLSLGIPEGHTYWQPSAGVTGNATSNGFGASNGWTTYEDLVGGLSLHDISGRSNLALSYLGGGQVYQGGGTGTGNAVIQELGLLETLSWERTTLSLFEQASYVPETGFGYAGVGGLAIPGGNPVVLQPGFGVTGTILTVPTQQLENSSLVEVDTKLSARSSLTFVGGYSLLHFFDVNLLDTNGTIFQAGYNRNLNRKDTIAVLYRFNALRFGSNNQTINDNLAQLSYARRVTGRLAFQAGAGPEISFFGMPIFTGPGTGGPPSNTLLNWSVSTSLNYQLEQSLLAVSYIHGVTGGAGVFTGSIGDTLTGSLSHQFARTIGGGFTTGYARNHALATVGAPTLNQTFDYWFGEATLTHPIGRTANLALSYEERYQVSNAKFCVGLACSTSLDIHQVSVGLSWQAAPIVF